MLYHNCLVLIRSWSWAWLTARRHYIISNTILVHVSVQGVCCACGIRISLVPRCSLYVHDVLEVILSWRSRCHCHRCWRPAIRWRCTKWAFIL